MYIKSCDLENLPALSLIYDEYRVHFEQASDLLTSEQFLKDRLGKAQAVIFAAFDEFSDEIMGFTLLYPGFSSLKLNATWTLNDMYIREKYRKFGVATRLLQRVKEFGDETGASWVSLKTGSENTKAQALYLKFGFEKDESCFYYYLKMQN